MDDGVSTVPLDLELCPIKKEPMDEEEQPMEVDDIETSMEVDTPVVLNDNDKYLIHLLETNFENEKIQGSQQRLSEVYEWSWCSGVGSFFLVSL